MILADSGKERNIKKILVAVFVMLILFAGTLAAQENIENKKIEFLISSVENLKGAKFIRNGAEYDGKKAAEHLRMKLEKAGGKVKTAEDFIQLIASKSYMTGKPYMIKIPDDKTVESEKFLREKLEAFNKQAGHRSQISETKHTEACGLTDADAKR